MVVAVIALCFSLAGTGVAAFKLGRNSVKARQIAPDAVQASEAKESTFSQVPSAAVADQATKAGDADTLDGNDSKAFPKVFSGRVSDATSVSELMFPVPQLKISVLSDAAAASGAGLVIRNDRPGGGATVAIGDTTDSSGGTPVAANTSSANINATRTPLFVTSPDAPGVALMVTCAIAANAEQICVGLLTGG
jgi:hypothetical protein